MFIVNGALFLSKTDLLHFLIFLAGEPNTIMSVVSQKFEVPLVDGWKGKEKIRSQLRPRYTADLGAPHQSHVSTVMMSRKKM
jgi:hypothetical protein